MMVVSRRLRITSGSIASPFLDFLICINDLHVYLYGCICFKFFKPREFYVQLYIESSYDKISLYKYLRLSLFSANLI